MLAEASWFGVGFRPPLACFGANLKRIQAVSLPARVCVLHLAPTFTRQPYRRKFIVDTAGG